MLFDFVSKYDILEKVITNNASTNSAMSFIYIILLFLSLLVSTEIIINKISNLVN
jgi:hypothetical protein